MRLYEYEGKELLRAQGIRVPRGVVAANPEEASVAAAETGGAVVVKAQVLSGGRGKAGLIRLAASRVEVENLAAEVLEASLKGERVRKVLVEEQLSIAKELYVSISVDRLAGCPLVLACAEGGVEIEEV